MILRFYFLIFLFYLFFIFFFFFLIIRPPPKSTLFPYPPLFRSKPPRRSAPRRLAVHTRRATSSSDLAIESSTWTRLVVTTRAALSRSSTSRRVGGQIGKIGRAHV